MHSESKPTRPAFRYHGGKWRIAPWIIAHLPAHKTYVEQFGGAMSDGAGKRVEVLWIKPW